MPLNLDDNEAKYQIKGFKPGHLQVNDQVYNHSIIIAADRLITDWKPQNIPQLKASDFEPIINLKPNILLIGTGNELEFPDISVYGHLLNLGIGVEIMDTHRACLTYNALTAEGRKVVAALII